MKHVTSIRNLDHINCVLDFYTVYNFDALNHLISCTESATEKPLTEETTWKTKAKLDISFNVWILKKKLNSMV
jgi:hypothetical protein